MQYAVKNLESIWLAPLAAFLCAVVDILIPIKKKLEDKMGFENNKSISFSQNQCLISMSVLKQIK